MTSRNQAGHNGAERNGRLDRFLGDALIGAMVLLGLVFCVGAVRAQTISAPLEYYSSRNMQTYSVNSTDTN